MELSKQVNSLEQAKRLKELGIRQDCNGHMWLRGQPAVDGEWMISRTYCSGEAPKEWGECYAAFTVGELGVMLPGISLEERQWVHYSKGEKYQSWTVDSWWEARPGLPDGYDPKPNERLTEAELRAAFLIWLLDKGHITPEQVNHRLTLT